MTDIHQTRKRFRIIVIIQVIVILSFLLYAFVQKGRADANAEIAVKNEVRANDFALRADSAIEFAMVERDKSMREIQRYEQVLSCIKEKYGADEIDELTRNCE